MSFAISPHLILVCVRAYVCDISKRSNFTYIIEILDSRQFRAIITIYVNLNEREKQNQPSFCIEKLIYFLIEFLYSKNFFSLMPNTFGEI